MAILYDIVYDVVCEEWIDCPLELADEIVDMNVYRVNFVSHDDLVEDSCNEECIATDGVVIRMDAQGADATQCIKRDDVIAVEIRCWGCIIVGGATYIRYYTDGHMYEYDTNSVREISYHTIDKDYSDGGKLMDHTEYSATVGSTACDPRASTAVTTYIHDGELILIAKMNDDRGGCYKHLVMTNYGYTEFDFSRYDKYYRTYELEWKFRGNTLIGTSAIETHIVELLKRPVY